ncbi:MULTISPECIES: RNA-binding S4 domain-containing protein [Leifsonia]|uniref:Ribosome-associated heat shock protein Hsp15 n=1 Tax=Leifsonia soli TaxID=582665 RepID=A0A852SZK0_9MICO|nr:MULTISPECIES: S4 domain-containing protein [Leifsonia]NYD73860.1 ribosome-associated heat shock protein Hsp15 [Leifsonia soli]SEA72338.1 heat shock protein Hsp15 [Leifsonia sp. 21MFCrub1.1]
MAGSAPHASPQAAARSSVRVDSWAWAVRLFKTRSAASDACKAGHLKVNGERAKPAQPVKVGDEVRALVGGVERIYIARRLITKRLSAAAAADCFDDRTPPPPPRTEAPAAVLRERGAGRPTKRERRLLEQLRGR